MKKTYFFILLFLTIIFTGSVQAQVVQVGQGTAGTTEVPLNTYYNHSFTQSIYKASDIIAANGGSLPTSLMISEIAYDYFYSTPQTKNNVTILMGHTTEDEFLTTSSWINVSTMQQVFAGSINFNAGGGWTPITLGTPFTWNGTSNIVVCVVNNHGSYSTGNNSTFHVTSTTTTSSLARRVDGSTPFPISTPPTLGSGTTCSYYPNITFKFENITCLPVNNLIATPASTTAAITWTPSNSENSWQLQYKASTDANWSAPIAVSTPSCNLNTLTSSTFYQVRVRAICAPGDTSLYGNISFMTLCSNITTLPWNDNFDTYGTGTTIFPPCWTRNTTYADRPYVSSANFVTSPASLYFYAGNTGTYNIAATPQFDASIPLNTVIVKFKYRTVNTTDALKVGVMTNPADQATFVQIAQVTAPTTGTWYDIEVPLSTYTGSGHYIALRADYTSTYCYAYVDNFEVSYAPPCSNIYNFSVNTGTNNSAVVSWDNTLGADLGWVLTYKQTSLASFNVNDAANITITLTSADPMPYIVPGLTVNLPYTFAMKTNCSGANWSTPKEITIPATHTVPFNEDFENLSNIKINMGTSNNSTVWVVGNYDANPGNSMYVSNDGGTTGTYDANTYTGAYTMIDFGNFAEYTLSFDFKSVAESCCDFLRVYTVPANYVIPTNDYPTGTGVVQIGGNMNQTNNQWEHKSFTLNSSYAGTIQKLVFFFKSDLSIQNPPGAMVDNIVITGTNCSAPVALAYSNLTQSSATITWTEAGQSSSWRIFWKANGSTVVDSADVSTTPSYTITNLLTNTQYSCWVKGNCGTAWSNSSTQLSFITLCGNITTLPWNDNFDDYGTGETIFPSCWTRNTTYTNRPYVSSSYYVTSPASLYFYAGNTGTYNIAATPQFDASIPLNTVAVKFKYRTTYSTDALKIGVMTNPSDQATFVQIAQVTAPTTGTWYDIEVPLSTYTGSGHYIALRADYTSTSCYAYVDNFEVSYIPPCSNIYNFSVNTGTNNSAVVSWDNTLGADLGWILTYKQTSLASFNVNDAANTTITLTSADPMPYIVSGLTVNLPYTFAMKTNCSGANWSTPKEIIIPATYTLPFNEDFENLSNIKINMGTSNTSTVWVVGNYDGNPGNSMYVSNDGGLTGNYGFSTYAGAYTVIDFGNFAEYNLSFDFKSVGESTYDFLRVYTVPVNYVIPTNGYPTGTGVSQIGGNMNLSNNQWEHKSFALSSSYAGTIQKLVFFFRSDGSGQYPPGAIVDNILITGSNCAAPEVLSYTNLTQTSAAITWTDPGQSSNWRIFWKANGSSIVDSANVSTTPAYTITNLLPSTSYSCWVKGNCGTEWSNSSAQLSFMTLCGIITTLPWSDNFDAYATNVMPGCWTAAISSSNYPHTTSGYSYSSPNSLMLAYSTMAVTPQFEQNVNNLIVTFKARQESATYSGSLIVGVISDPSDPGTFIPVQTLQFSEPGQFLDFEVSLAGSGADNAHNIAFKQETTTGYWYYWIDDVLVYAETSCDAVANLDTTGTALNSITVQWTGNDDDLHYIAQYKPQSSSTWLPQTSPISGTTYTFTGLTKNTCYDIRVKAVCPLSVESDWSTITACTKNNIGIAEIDNNSVILYPNPATDKLGVMSEYSFSQCIVLNMLGKVVAEINPSSAAFTIDVSSYSAGVYFIKLANENAILIKKFIKK